MLNETKSITRRWGSLKLELNHSKKYFLITPSGLINPSFIRFAFAHAKRFGHLQQDGWDYIVDTSRFIIPNPFNLLLLRQIRSLPNIRSYIVFAPSPLLRFIEKMIGIIIYPDFIIGTQKDFDEFLETNTNRK